MNTSISLWLSTPDECLVGSKNHGISMSVTCFHPNDFQVQFKSFQMCTFNYMVNRCIWHFLIWFQSTAHLILTIHPSRSPQLAVLHSGKICSVYQIADGSVVIIVHLGHLKLRINGYFEDIGAGNQVCHIHPLAVQIVQVHIRAVNGNACAEIKLKS